MLWVYVASLKIDMVVASFIYVLIMDTTLTQHKTTLATREKERKKEKNSVMIEKLI